MLLAKAVYERRLPDTGLAADEREPAVSVRGLYKLHSEPLESDLTLEQWGGDTRVRAHGYIVSSPSVGYKRR